VLDNRIENLELLASQAEHIERHREQLNAGKAWLSPERLSQAAYLGWETRRRKEEAR
jgi:hypothetical protein